MSAEISSINVFLATARSERQVLPLALQGLLVSVCMSAHQQRLEPDNPYLSISEVPRPREYAMLISRGPEFQTSEHAIARARPGLQVSP